MEAIAPPSPSAEHSMKEEATTTSVLLLRSAPPCSPAVHCRNVHCEISRIELSDTMAPPEPELCVLSNVQDEMTAEDPAVTRKNPPLASELQPVTVECIMDARAPAEIKTGGWLVGPVQTTLSASKDSSEHPFNLSHDNREPGPRAKEASSPKICSRQGQIPVQSSIVLSRKNVPLGSSTTVSLSKTNARSTYNVLKEER
eukprot:183888-Rhodomonas_salina.3